jgi:predicted RNA methylase
VEAYRLATSDESDPAAASVDDDVLASRSTYGQNPTRLDVNGLPWIQHLEWLQEQVKQEQPVTISYERRKEMQVAARQILAELSHEGVKSTPPLTTADIKQKHLESQTRASDEGLTMPPTRSQIKKARRKFQEVLDDPVLGPFMSKLDTSAVQSALVLPRRGTPRLGPSQLPDIVSGFTLGERRATMHAWTEAMKPKDFVSPLGLDVSKQDTIEVDHDMEAQADGWRVVSRRKRLRTHPVNDYSMAKSVSPGSHDGDVESKNIGGSSLEDIAEETA